LFRRAFSGIMFVLLVISMLTLSLRIQPAKAATIIVPDQYPTIQAAIDAASAGDTIQVKAGTYSENVEVNKKLSLQGAGWQTTIVQAANPNETVFDIRADYVTVTGFTARNAPMEYGMGIYSSYANIFQNCFENNYNGIYMLYSDSSSITGNRVFGSHVDGIYVCGSGNTISSNTISGAIAGVGLSAYSSKDNLITNNDISDCVFGIGGGGSAGAVNNIVICGNQIHDISEGIHIDPGSSGILITSNTITAASNAIGTYRSSNISIYHNNFVYNRFGSNCDSKNTWDNGYPSGGNYWSDYATKYPNATEIDNSDLWNTPYVIDANNSDHYPLMNPWGTVVQRTLTVSSARDNPVPGIGPHTYNDGDPVTCSVTSPAIEGSVSYSCTGWIGTGSVPSSGTGTSTGSFIITQDSTITWTWIVTPPVQRKLTVSSAHDTPVPDNGPNIFSDGQSVTCSISNPVVVDGGVSYTCTGWTGTGSVPSSGTGTSTGPFYITQDSTITWNWIQSQPGPSYEPRLSVPVYAPIHQKAHKGTTVAFVFEVTNDGEAADTITLDFSETCDWSIQLSQSSVTLGSHQSTQVLLYLKIGDVAVAPIDTITIKGESKGNLSKISSCQVLAEPFQSGSGLLNLQLKFFNRDIQSHILRVVYVPNYVKLIPRDLFLNPTEEAWLYAVFDPMFNDVFNEPTLNSFLIHVIDFATNEGAWITTKFDEYSITATSFDVTRDSYSFPNQQYEYNTCYGMAATAILRRGMTPPTYELGKDEAESMIKGFQGDIVNWKLAVTLLIPSWPDESIQYDDLKKCMKDLDEPMILALYWPGGELHAVVAYKIVESGNKAYILCYDNEQPFGTTPDPFTFTYAFTYALYDKATERLLFYGSECKFLVYKPPAVVLSSRVLKDGTTWFMQNVELLGTDDTRLIIDCPVNVTITDQYARVISDNGTNQIPNATVASTNDVKYFCLHSELNYSVFIRAYGSGDFSLAILEPTVNDSVSVDIYEHVSVISGTQSTLGITRHQINQTMKIDHDGDGVIDELKGPSVSVELSLHDDAVTNVVPLRTVVGQGFPVHLNVTPCNRGNFTETFNVTVYVNGTQIEMQPVNLTKWTSITMTFTLNTTGFAYGNYAVIAVADTVLNEADITNNNRTCDILIHVGVPGDTSGPILGVYDGKCDMRDVSYLIIRFNSKPGSSNWNPNADVNGDNTVNMRDISIAIINFNQHE